MVAHRVWWKVFHAPSQKGISQHRSLWYRAGLCGHCEAARRRPLRGCRQEAPCPLGPQPRAGATRAHPPEGARMPRSRRHPQRREAATPPVPGGEPGVGGGGWGSPHPHPQVPGSGAAAERGGGGERGEQTPGSLLSCLQEPVAQQGASRQGASLKSYCPPGGRTSQTRGRTPPTQWLGHILLFADVEPAQEDQGGLNFGRGSWRRPPSLGKPSGPRGQRCGRGVCTRGRRGPSSSGTQSRLLSRSAQRLGVTGHTFSSPS